MLESAKLPNLTCLLTSDKKKVSLDKGKKRNYINTKVKELIKLTCLFDNGFKSLE